MPRVMILDDSRLVRLHVRRCLEGAGFEVKEPGEVSAREILAEIEAWHPDLLISDYQMPGCTGITIVRALVDAHLRIPVLVLTAYHDEDVRVGLQRLGVRRVLHKPITADHLVGQVRAVLSEAAASDGGA